MPQSRFPRPGAASPRTPAPSHATQLRQVLLQLCGSPATARRRAASPRAPSPSPVHNAAWTKKHSGALQQIGADGSEADSHGVQRRGLPVVARGGGGCCCVPASSSSSAAARCGGRSLRVRLPAFSPVSRWVAAAALCVGGWAVAASRLCPAARCPSPSSCASSPRCGRGRRASWLLACLHGRELLGLSARHRR